MKEFYFPKEIESFVQREWDINHTFKVTEDNNKEKFYCLSMLPYPSGNLHIGHVRNYTISDVIARYQRMLGKNVLHPMGWDAFGLPAEKAAIKNNASPAFWTYNNINYMKKQLKLLGLSYDWSREIITCQPEYYRWEQWFFIYLYEKKLAYKKTALVNWCAQDNTVLANEQVVHGRCWRCNQQIEKKEMNQWFIKITKYADELLDDLNKLKHWPEKVKNMQYNWIGRLEGIEIKFSIENSKENIIVYTVRPEILTKITCIIISANHPLLSKLNKNIINFIKQCFINTKKTYKFLLNKKIMLTNLHAIHPLKKNKLPILVANFLAIDNDLNTILLEDNFYTNQSEFTREEKISIKSINMYQDDKNLCINIDNTADHASFSKNIINHLITSGIGKYKVKYNLHDWNVSRQRYWGAPIPMITLQDGTITPIPNEQLPVVLPQNIDINNIISNPLKNNPDWIKITYNGQLAIRETDTFDTFIESSWYYARYTCPNYDHGIINSVAANYWLPVDQYVGGIEHATMHLMYFRFYHKLLRDAGFVNSDEPVKRLLCQGMVLADSFYYIDNHGKQIWVPLNNVDIKRNKQGVIVEARDNTGRVLIHAGMSKMSKSKGNGINPQTIINQYGADTLRLYIMFATSAEMELEWQEAGIEGANRFLKRVWKLVYQHYQRGPVDKLNINNLNNMQRKMRRAVHNTIIKVTDDIDRRQTFNTAIAAIMKLVNKLIHMSQEHPQDRAVLQEALLIIIRMLYPYTPHITFILWKALGNTNSIDNTLWPLVDYTALLKDTKLIIIQINGKLRGKINVPYDADEKIIHTYALKENNIIKYLKGTTVHKIIYVQNKLINIIAS